jgi:GNAT superfamily N-acetyltransferase
MKPKKHWYMRYVVTRPEYQYMGAAGQLLQWLTDRADADADGCELYLESTPMAKPVYERLGFVGVDKVVLELEKKAGGPLEEKNYIETCMIRPSRRMEKGQLKKRNVRSRL